MSTQTTTATLSALSIKFSIVSNLMNTNSALVICGGGCGIVTVQPDNPYYDRLKAVLSDIGNDLAAEMLIVRETNSPTFRP